MSGVGEKEINLMIDDYVNKDYGSRISKNALESVKFELLNAKNSF